MKYFILIMLTLTLSCAKKDNEEAFITDTCYMCYYTQANDSFVLDNNGNIIAKYTNVDTTQTVKLCDGNKPADTSYTLSGTSFNMSCFDVE